MISINPYLHYNGNCLEAFEHYKKAFGGEFHMLMRYSQAPGADPNAPDGIMHIALPIGSNMHLQGSDFPPAMDRATIGNNFSIAINTDNEADSRRIFEILSEGGQVSMPLTETFWSPLFGMCVDKFGVSWFVSQAQ